MFFCIGIGRKNVLLLEDVKELEVRETRANKCIMTISVFLVVIIEKVLEDS